MDLKSQSKRFWSKKKKKVSKRKYCLQIHCFLHPRESTHFFFEIHKIKVQEMVEYSINMIQYFFFDLTSLLFFSFNLKTLTRATELHGRPIQKFDAKMMRLIYTICSKNSTKKIFMKSFLQMTGNLLCVKKQERFSKKF